METSGDVIVSDNAKVEVAGNDSFTILAYGYNSNIAIEGGQVIAAGDDSFAIYPFGEFVIDGGVVLGIGSDLTDVVPMETRTWI